MKSNIQEEVCREGRTPDRVPSSPRIGRVEEEKPVKERYEKGQVRKKDWQHVVSVKPGVASAL